VMIWRRDIAQHAARDAFAASFGATLGG
jgi:hypothetical protein